MMALRQRPPQARSSPSGGEPDAARTRRPPVSPPPPIFARRGRHVTRAGAPARRSGARADYGRVRLPERRPSGARFHERVIVPAGRLARRDRPPPQPDARPSRRSQRGCSQPASAASRRRRSWPRRAGCGGSGLVLGLHRRRLEGPRRRAPRSPLLFGSARVHRARTCCSPRSAHAPARRDPRASCRTRSTCSPSRSRPASASTARSTKLTEHMDGAARRGVRADARRDADRRVRQDALKKLAERVARAEVAAFVRAIIQADQLGISLGRILRVQAADTRLPPPGGRRGDGR